MSSTMPRAEAEGPARDRGGRAEPGTILLIGYHLSNQAGSFGVSEGLASRLPGVGWNVLSTSSRRAPVARLLDMLQTVWARRNEYAVAHVDVYSGRAFAWAELVCRELRWLKKPFILTLRGGNLPEFARRWPGRVRRLLGRAAAVTTPSAYLRERLSAARSDLLLIPNAIDLATYPFRLRESATPRLVWIRAFHEIYNPELAARVVAALGREFPALHLTMTGRDRDGSQSRVVRLVSELGVSDRITIRGPAAKAEVPHRLQEGDIYLNTARIDNTPVTVMEAMACGLCVVSTNVGGIPFLVRDQEDALLVASDDPEAMAGAVRRLLREPELARRVSSTGRTAMESYDWAAVLPQWESLLRSVERG